MTIGTAASAWRRSSKQGRQHKSRQSQQGRLLGSTYPNERKNPRSLQRRTLNCAHSLSPSPKLH
jgi:hypothetical protein